MNLGYRRLTVLALAVVVLGGLLLAPTALAAENPAWVAGTISGTGYKYTVPLNGATVDLWQVKMQQGPPPEYQVTYSFDPTSYSAMTTVDGQYVINALTQDDESLPLYYSGSDCIVVPSAQYYRTSTDLNDYLPGFTVAEWMWTQTDATYKTLTVLPSVYKGLVKNKKTNKAIKGVKVTVAGNKNYAFKTNSSGRFTTYKVTTDKQTICLLKPNTKYNLKFTKSGYKARTLSYTSFPADYDPNNPDAAGTFKDIGTVKLTKK